MNCTKIVGGREENEKNAAEIRAPAAAGRPGDGARERVDAVSYTHLDVYKRQDDGLLDVLLVNKVSRLKVAGVIAKYQAGRHFSGDEIIPELRQIITFVRGREVQIVPEKEIVTNIDGECDLRPEVSIRVLPAAARFVLPARLAEAYTPLVGLAGSV